MTLSTLMKQYEHEYRRKVNPNDYLLLRLDGRAFHTYTRGLDKPYDTLLMEAMDHTTKELCEAVDGVKFAYVESDEISLVMTGFKNLPLSESNPDGLQFGDLWMGGTEAKVLSLAASQATLSFNLKRMEQEASTGKKLHKQNALFDARLWTFPGTAEGYELVKSYVKWRRRDSIKNSTTMAALAEFGHKATLSKNTDEKWDMLRNVGKPWEELPDGFKFGRYFEKKTRTETVEFRHGKTQEVMTAEAERRYWEGRPLVDFEQVVTDWAVPARK